MVAKSDDERLIESLSQRHCSSQWSRFLALLFQELQVSAGEAESKLFFRHVGGRLAAELSLGEQQTLQSLEAAMNQRWQELDWGTVELHGTEKGISLTHLACPLPSSASSHNSGAVMAAVLEGAYAQWLEEQQDSETEIPLRLTSVEALRYEFFYGYF